MLKKILTLLVLLVIVIAGMGWWLYGSEANNLSVNERAADVQPLTDDGAPSLEAISREDLPPEGTRSLFDHIMAENDGLPYPFEKLVEVLASYDRDGRKPTTLMVPFSRSLLKADADLTTPRVVLAADMNPPESDDLAPVFKGRFFLGFTEGGGEIEVITYNEAAGRFEYQLVTDYREGGTPTIAYAQRSICLACHANEATIFPVRPWEETTAQPAVTAAAIKAIGADSYHGLPVAGTLANAERIDGFTNLGNSIITTQRLWIDGCGANAETSQRCRHLMLELGLEFAIDAGTFSDKDPRVAELLSLQKKTWPASGVVLPDADILNRNPFAKMEDGPGLKTSLRNMVDGLLGRGDDKDFDALPALPAELDPLTPRPHKAVYTASSLDGIYGVAQIFAETDTALLEKLTNYQLPKLHEALASADVQSLLAAKPINRANVMMALVKALSGRTPEYAYATTDHMSEPLLDGEPPIEISSGSVLQHFEQYCFGCHRGNPSAKLNFMAGKSETEVLEKIAETDAIRDALDWERYAGSSKENKMMPPRNSWQRRKLKKAIDNGENPLPEMMEAVPSMFDF